MAATLGAFITPFVLSSLTVALPNIGREFSLSAVELGWVSTAYLLTTGAFLVPFGSVADRYGRKRVFIVGMVIVVISSGLSALAPSYGWLLVARSFQGLGAAMTFSTMTAILTAVYGPGERGRVLGINVAAVYIGLSVGPVVGGLMTERLGWRSVFAVPLAMSLVVLGFVLRSVKHEWVEPRAGRFDYAGAAVYAVGLVALMWGLSRLPGTIGGLVTAAGVLLLVIFAWWETRVAQPAMNIDLFRRNRIFALSNLAAFTNYAATFAASFLLSLYLQYARGFSPEEAGLLLIFQPALMAILSPWAGRLSDRIEPRVVVSTGMGFTVVGLGLLAFLHQSTPIWYLILTLCLLGVGFALFSSPNTNTVMSSVERRFLGVASATLGTMRILGQMFSMALAMLVFALYLGPVEAKDADPLALTAGIALVFGIFAVVCIVGLLASMARGTMHGEDETAERQN